MRGTGPEWHEIATKSAYNRAGREQQHRHHSAICRYTLALSAMVFIDHIEAVAAATSASNIRVIILENAPIAFPDAVSYWQCWSFKTQHILSAIFLVNRYKKKKSAFAFDRLTGLRIGRFLLNGTDSCGEDRNDSKLVWPVKARRQGTARSGYIWKAQYRL